MLAVMKEHKDVSILLIEKGANLELFNEVSVCILILYHKQCITENKQEVVCSKKTIIIHYITI